MLSIHSIQPKEVTLAGGLYMASYAYYEGIQLVKELGFDQVHEEHVIIKDEATGKRAITATSNQDYSGRYYEVCCGDVCIKSWERNLWPKAPLRSLDEPSVPALSEAVESPSVKEQLLRICGGKASNWLNLLDGTSDAASEVRTMVLLDYQHNSHSEWGIAYLANVLAHIAGSITGR